MQDLLDSVESSLLAGFVYPAFMSALCLPDICGYISHPTENNVGKRYKEWFEAYMPENYRGLMSGEEAYGLRCVVLHNGELSLAQFTNRSTNRNVILDKFELFNDGMHLLRATNNTINGVPQPSLIRLSAVKYCKDIIEGVREWGSITGQSLGEHNQVFAINEGGDTFVL